jgi:hypothetical protein
VPTLPRAVPIAVAVVDIPTTAASPISATTSAYSTRSWPESSSNAFKQPDFSLLCIVSRKHLESHAGLQANHFFINRLVGQGVMAAEHSLSPFVYDPSRFVYVPAARDPRNREEESKVADGRNYELAAPTHHRVKFAGGKRFFTSFR